MQRKAFFRCFHNVRIISANVSEAFEKKHNHKQVSLESYCQKFSLRCIWSCDLVVSLVSFMMFKDKHDLAVEHVTRCGVVLRLLYVQFDIWILDPPRPVKHSPNFCYKRRVVHIFPDTSASDLTHNTIYLGISLRIPPPSNTFSYF